MPLDILLVDDEPSIRLSVGDALKAAGHRVRLAIDGAEGASVLAANPFDLVITDIRLPKLDGLALFKKIRAEAPSTDVILITAYGNVSDAVNALRDGAIDFLTKPFDFNELLHRIARVEGERTLRNELVAARLELDRGTSSPIVGHSQGLTRLLERIDTFAASEAPVLILGESGTGKELVARQLHDRSPRKGFDC